MCIRDRSNRYATSSTTIAVAGPERSGSGSGFPVPSITIWVRRPAAGDRLIVPSGVASVGGPGGGPVVTGPLRHPDPATARHAPTIHRRHVHMRCIQHRRQWQLRNGEPADLAVELITIEPRARDAPVARGKLPRARAQVLARHPRPPQTLSLIHISEPTRLLSN